MGLNAPHVTPDEVRRVADSHRKGKAPTIANLLDLIAEADEIMAAQAAGAAGELGLFQIHPVHRRWVTALTGEPWPATARSTLNGQVAFVLWKQTGWRAWSTARKCGLR